MAFSPSEPIDNDQTERIFAYAKNLGFDWFHLKIESTNQIALRLAHNQLSRENIQKDQTLFHFNGILQRRQAGFCLPLFETKQIFTELDRLRREILLQAPDDEIVIPKTYTGTPHIYWTQTPSLTSTHDLKGFDEEVGDAVYDALRGIHQEGLRITGFVEVISCHRINLYYDQKSSSSLEWITDESGATISLTLDLPETDLYSRPAPGGVLSAKRSLIRVSPKALSRTLLAAIKDLRSQMNLILKSEDQPSKDFGPKKVHLRSISAVQPGSYQVVLHPMAAYEFLQTMFMYNLFDQRKIDEGRTYLSRADAIRQFPQGLCLERPFVIKTGECDEQGQSFYVDLPLSTTGQPCNNLTLISGGELKGTIVSDFWSEKTGQPATFSTYQAPPMHLDFSPPFVHLAQNSPIQMTVTQDLKELISSTENGLYVANFWYLRMVSEMDGILTGMTRDGLFKIENGEITEPLCNMRWHENPFKMLANINGITKEKMFYGMSRHLGVSRSPLGLIPALRINEFHFSSISTF